MYHKTDHTLNKEIAELSRIRINVSLKKILFGIVIYLAILPIVVYLAIKTEHELVIYLYLIPLAPVVFVTYIVFTGKLKWLIKALHKLQKLF